MAQFDVYRLAGGVLVVDLQTDLKPSGLGRDDLENRDPRGALRSG